MVALVRPQEARSARWRRLGATVTVVVTAVVALLAVPAIAAPADPEGGSKKLRDALASAAKGHVQATARLEHAKKRQLSHAFALTQAQNDARAMQNRVTAVATKSYRLGRVSTTTLLLNSTTPDDFLERAVRLDTMAQLDARTLMRYRQALDAAARAKQGIDAEVREQQRQVTILAQKKREAERALATVGGASSGGFVGASSSAARSVPRNSDGSLPDEGCSRDDPTSSGCVTPRLLNAYQQARGAGFRRYTACYSVRSSGEHPLGRACDFSAATSGFENVDARGGDRGYGDRLAAYLVRNAGRLGVMYVIWYRQIWMPGTGWRSYSGSGGPNATHTNHVHLSVL